MALAEEPMEKDVDQVGQQGAPDESFWKVFIDFAQKLIEKTYG
jgi:hypothetical protein